MQCIFPEPRKHPIAPSKKHPIAPSRGKTVCLGLKLDVFFVVVFFLFFLRVFRVFPLLLLFSVKFALGKVVLRPLRPEGRSKIPGVWARTYEGLEHFYNLFWVSTPQKTMAHPSEGYFCTSCIIRLHTTDTATHHAILQNLLLLPSERCGGCGVWIL